MIPFVIPNNIREHILQYHKDLCKVWWLNLPFIDHLKEQYYTLHLSPFIFGSITKPIVASLDYASGKVLWKRINFIEYKTKILVYINSSRG